MVCKVAIVVLNKGKSSQNFEDNDTNLVVYILKAVQQRRDTSRGFADSLESSLLLLRKLNEEMV